MIASANGWDHVLKAFYLLTALREEAAKVLQMLTTEYRSSYEAPMSTLELRFGENYPPLHQLQLKNRQQKAGET